MDGWNPHFRIIKGGAVATQQMDVGNRIKQVMVKFGEQFNYILVTPFKLVRNS